MRIPLPERFKPKQVVLFATCLFLAQTLEGTSPTYAALLFLYIVLFALAFGIAGGIVYPSGAWVFFTGMLTCILGNVVKVFLGEPGESHLHAPLTTMAAYCVGMAGMVLAAFVSRSFRPRSGLLANMAVGSRMKQAAIGCLVLGVAGTLLTLKANKESATLGTAFAQLNHFTQMAIILATTYQISHSRGKSSSNWIVWSAGSFLFAMSLLAYSKEGMFVAFLAWLVPCAGSRFDFSKRQILLWGLAIAVTLYYLVPYSQYGRRSRGEALSFESQIVLAQQYLLHLDETRQLYLESTEVADASGQPHFYDSSQGLLDRLQMLAIDDALIDYTDNTQTIGTGPLTDSFLNTIPRFIWANKPIYMAGNSFGREIGVIGQDDTSTGISFSPTADAYHEASWFGVAFLLPLVMILVFLIADSLSGDARKAPWGLLFIAISAHAAPEGMLSGTVWMATNGAEIIIFVAVISSYVLPKLVAVALGAERTVVRPTVNFRPGGLV